MPRVISDQLAGGCGSAPAVVTLLQWLAPPGWHHSDIGWPLHGLELTLPITKSRDKAPHSHLATLWSPSLWSLHGATLRLGSYKRVTTTSSPPISTHNNSFFNMSFPDSSALRSISGVNAVGSGNVVQSQAAADILTYRYKSRLVYVTPGESYEQALDFAQEVFPELKDIDRDLISLEVQVSLRGQNLRRTVQIGRMAWPAVIRTLPRFETVEICVAPVPQPSSSSLIPPPYASEAAGHWIREGHKRT